MADQESPPLLPFWATVESAYRAAWFYRWEYLKIIWCWLLIAIPVECLYSWFATSLIGNMAGTGSIQPPDIAIAKAMAPLREAFYISIPIALFHIFFCASIAVAWHRLILRQEKISSTHYLRFDGVVRDYFIFGVFIRSLTFICLLAYSYLLGLMSKTPSTTTWGFPMLWALIIAVMVLTTRLSVILPAKALELKDVTLRAILQKTSWNLWRLFWGYMLCSLPSAFLIIFIIKMGGTGPMVHMMHRIGTLSCMIIAMPFELTFLSLSYQHFFEREKQSLPQTSSSLIEMIIFALVVLTISAWTELKAFESSIHAARIAPTLTHHSEAKPKDFPLMKNFPLIMKGDSSLRSE